MTWRAGKTRARRRSWFLHCRSVGLWDPAPGGSGNQHVNKCKIPIVSDQILFFMPNIQGPITSSIFAVLGGCSDWEGWGEKQPSKFNIFGSGGINLGKGSLWFGLTFSPICAQVVTKTPGPRHLSMITSIGREVFQVNNFVKIRLVTSGTSIIMFLLNITDKSVTASHSDGERRSTSLAHTRPLCKQQCTPGRLMNQLLVLLVIPKSRCLFLSRQNEDLWW